MGAVKSSYATTQYMLYYIQREEYAKISQLLKKHPQVLEATITKNSKMTPLYRACFNGDLKMVKFLIEDCGAKVNTLSGQGESPLMVTCKRNHKEIVRYLLGRGADVNMSGPNQLTTIDYAILPGFYEVALMLYERVKDKELRTVPEYEDLAQVHQSRYVNYQIFLDSLAERIQPENVRDFLTKPVKTFKDPVVDPRQNWGQWLRRTVEFKDPPLCQRQDLPQDLQPQKVRWGKLRHTLNNMTMSPMVRQKPHFNPVKQNSHKAMSQNQLQNAPSTNQQMNVRQLN